MNKQAVGGWLLLNSGLGCLWLTLGMPLSAALLALLAVNAISVGVCLMLRGA